MKMRRREALKTIAAASVIGLEWNPRIAAAEEYGFFFDHGRRLLRVAAIQMTRTDSGSLMYRTCIGNSSRRIARKGPRSTRSSRGRTETEDSSYDLVSLATVLQLSITWMNWGR